MRPRVVLSVGNFFFSLFSTAVIYIVVPYLTTLMPEAYAGLVIAAGALVACIAFPFLPRLVARYGAQQLALFIAILEMLSLLMLAASPGAIAGALFVALAIGLQPFLAYELDLLLEATVAQEGVTGRVRALFTSAWNVAGLASPLLMGALLASSDAYGRVFLAAAAAVVPFIVLFAARRLPPGQPPHLSHLANTLRTMARDRDLSAVTFGHFLMYLFFAWSPFYTPIYLHSVLGIPWNTLGWMFAVMLLPYVLIEYPAAIIADKYIGDKEMLFVGFLLAGLSLASIGLLTPASSLSLILFILIVSRVGTALIESMTEGHFFRRVSEKDVTSISVFRGIWPLANLIAPIVGSLILIFGSYPLLFALTGGFVALAGAGATLLIRDFR